MADRHDIEELNEQALAAIQGGGTTSVPSFTGGVFVASADVNGTDAAARMSCSNNLKQIGLASLN